MPTGTAATTARRTPFQGVHFLCKDFTYADTGTTITIGTLPAGALIIRPMSGVDVQIAFNGNATNTCDIGPSTDTGTNLWATLLALGTIAFVPMDEAVTLKVASDTIVQAAIVSTAAASAGSGTVVIAYIPLTTNG